MEDEIKTENNGDAIVSDKEIQEATKMVLDKDQEVKKSIEQETEARIRKKIEEENRIKELEKKVKVQEEAIKRQEEEKQRIASDKDRELEELKKQIGSSKAKVNTQSPFGRRDANTPETNFKDLPSETINEISEESKEKFKEWLDIKDDKW